MTKQEKIKEAYGKDWEIVKNNVDENGWLDPYFNLKYFESFLDCDVERNKNLFRPIILKSVENNNGWIKIETEEQYNKLENGLYEWYNIETKEQTISDLHKFGRYTHYKEIKYSEKLPIY